jgi:Tol biopolymer transport system component
MLWVRRLDTLAAQLLAGTEGAAFPFWSPDSRFLAFHAEGKLKKIEASGGTPVTLCDAVARSTGSWNQDDVILFVPDAGSGIFRVSGSGGTPSPVTLDVASGDTQHHYPFFLPDGRHFLYFVVGSRARGAADPRAVHVGSLDPGDPGKPVLQGGSNAKYAQGHLLFMRGTTLMTQPFDLTRLSVQGEAWPLAEAVQVAEDVGTAGAFSVAESGALVYQSGPGVIRSELIWFDRSGAKIATLGDQADYVDLAVSPDGRQAVVSVLDPQRGTRDLWVYDIGRGVRTRLTFDPAEDSAPSWSPDGSRIVFASGRSGRFDLYQKASSGRLGAEDVLLEDSLGKFPASWSPDGQWLVYVAGGGIIGRSDLWVVPLVGDRKPAPFLQAPYIETHGQFSPDGRWIAYSSNETGQFEVYVTSFPRAGGKWRVSPAGGRWPRWRRDGTEIFYLAADDTLTSVPVKAAGAVFNAGAIRPLFRARPRPLRRLDAYHYDLSPDGRRVLVNTFVDDPTAQAVTLVVNWTAAVRN